jgi:hypothetical protein
VFRTRNVHDDYRLGVISKACLAGTDGADATRSICRRFREAVRTHQTHAIYYDNFVQNLIGAQPRAALDGLCGGTIQDLTRGIRLLHSVSQGRDNPFDRVPADDLLSWCDEDAEARYPAIAGVIRIAIPASNAAHLVWTSTARQLLDRAPDQVTVLRAYVGQFGHIFPGEVTPVERHLPCCPSTPSTTTLLLRNL